MHLANNAKGKRVNSSSCKSAPVTTSVHKSWLAFFRIHTIHLPTLAPRMLSGAEGGCMCTLDYALNNTRRTRTINSMVPQPGSFS